jgi:AraC family transcriptional regulator of adaptative response / DNA-3-methyladenine glycosylase II
MTLDHDICYRAVASRDPRFDGRFFTAVLTTGVYCRPVCPARTPRRENVRFFPCAAAAAEAGFRPCRRCRPETSPGTPAWLGTSASVSRALRLIAEGALDRGGVDDLAARLGLGARHLRRLFQEHLGASPLAVALTRRVHFAKRLLDETDLSMTQVALAAGFGSLRRFNAAMRQTFGRAPSELRRGSRGGTGSGNRGGFDEVAQDRLLLRLSYRPPLDWPGLLAYLGPRAIPGVEVVYGDSYLRAVTCNGQQGVMRVRPAAASSRDALILEVPACFAPHLLELVARTRRLFDLDADPGEIARQLKRDPLLAASLRRRPGLRVPGAFDRFEVAVRAVLGQQVSVRGATTLAGRLVEIFGEPLAGPAGAELMDKTVAGGTAPWPDRLFPRPARLAATSVSRLAAVGLPRRRAAAVRTLARAVQAGELDLAGALDLATFVRRTAALPGLGDWTAQYLALRVLHEPDAFPASDLGLRRALEAAGLAATPAAVRRRAEAWRPWRAYAVMHLWQQLGAARASSRIRGHNPRRA